MYKETKKLNLPEIDQQILKFWEEQQIFKKSVDQRSEENRFVFYEGPPSANGKPGIHHVMARTVKDLFCRFQTMQGKRVERKGGWDTHGLPVELKVEQELGITKEDIGTKITIEEYNQRCRETVMRYKDMWDDITVKMGYWVDLDQPYITFENNYIESVWHLLKRLYEKDLLYKGYTIQPFSPAAGTGLSSHELNMPGTYKDVSDTSAVAQFKVERNADSEFLFEGVEDGEVYFIAWTTTPWTLPSNTALAVGKKIDYVRVKTFNPYTKIPVNIILAEELLGKWFKPAQAEASFEDYKPEDKVIPYQVTGTYKGAQFEGLKYEQLLSYVQPEGKAFEVLLGDFVSTKDGTGIVHLAPSFGSDDMMTARKYGVGALTLVDRSGKFVDEVTDFAGRYVKNYRDQPKEEYRSVDIDISIKLKQENKAFNVQKYLHSYPHCWRTDKPVLYYPLDSWFVRSTAVKDRLIELNKTINWKPAHTGEKRFGNWLENLQDWNLSRSRYWGIPLPIWRTEDAEVEKCIGSVAELKAEIEKANDVLGLNQSVPEDLHRPYIDDVTLVSDDGRPMTREADLIDVWFDSGSMPYAQWHYPFENEEIFKQNFPADFIAEGVDQTRGWFFTLHAIGTMVHDSIAFKNVVSNGLVLDKNGLKMSKRLGNAVDPFTSIAEHGADAVRWYMMSNSAPWDNLKFDEAGVVENRNKFFGTLYNTYSFFALYANVDEFAYSANPTPVGDRPEIDRWIISKLNSLLAEYTEAMADYEPTKACRAVESFVVDHLSNWFVRLSRRRYWKTEMSGDKKVAFETLYECLYAVSQMMAPVAPFFADWLYQNLTSPLGEEAAKAMNRQESVHLSLLQKANMDHIDQALEQRMDYAQRISSLILSLRKKETIRVRQPLQRVLLPIVNDDFEAQVEAVEDLILTEVNIKEIEYVRDTSGIIVRKIKPNFKTLGRRMGKQMKAAAAAINQLTQEDIHQIEQTGQYTLEIDGTAHELTTEDFVITYEDIPGWLVATDNEVTVALDVNISEELLAEGTARELVNRIQNLRKDKDFNVTDRILVKLEAHDSITSAVESFGSYIQAETLADQLELVAEVAGDQIELPDEVKLGVLVERV